MKEKPYIIDGERVTRDEYIKGRSDRFLITVPKGDKERIKAYAAKIGKSLNAYIVELIENDMLNK